jgi:hypothetical protein
MLVMASASECVCGDVACPVANGVRCEAETETVPRVEGRHR